MPAYTPVAALRRVIREQLLKILEEDEDVVSSAPSMDRLGVKPTTKLSFSGRSKLQVGKLKPGVRLRYTGDDMQVSAKMKVLSVGPDGVTVGDQRGQTKKLTQQDLEAGEYVVDDSR